MYSIITGLYRYIIMKKVLPLAILLTLITCISCNNENGFKEKLPAAINTYSDIVYANYQDALSTAQVLDTAIDNLVADPSQNTLDATKSAWLSAREAYGQTEAFRFYGGPIDDEDGPEGQLNAWPLDESYIDYVTASTNGTDAVDGSNIINSPNNFPIISPEVIAGLNENGSETNISSGYHAIEFLLWGQDQSSGPGGGERSFTDYVTDGTGTNGNQDRRGRYLQSVSELLVSDLQSLVDEWAPNGTYRAFFNSDDQLDNSLERILNGIGKLSKGELAGERMFVAFDLRSKEDESSCFSDNTHRDIVTNALGIQNVLRGTYTRLDGTTVSGTSIIELVAIGNKTLADELRDLSANSVASTEAIQAPFDQEFLNELGRERILEAINLLRSQGDKIAEVATELGFTVDPSDI